MDLCEFFQICRISHKEEISGMTHLAPSIPDFSFSGSEIISNITELKTEERIFIKFLGYIRHDREKN